MRLMWTDNERKTVFRAIDSLEGAPDANPAARWVYGVVLATLALFLSVYASVRWTLGAASLIAAFALLAHSHWFWSPSEKWCAVQAEGDTHCPSRGMSFSNARARWLRTLLAVSVNSANVLRYSGIQNRGS